MMEDDNFFTLQVTNYGIEDEAEYLQERSIEINAQFKFEEVKIQRKAHLVGRNDITAKNKSSY